MTILFTLQKLILQFFLNFGFILYLNHITLDLLIIKLLNTAVGS